MKNTILCLALSLLSTPLLAAGPYPSTFYDVKADLYQGGLQYFIVSHEPPQTLSVYRHNSRWMTAGHFDRRITRQWRAFVNVTSEQMLERLKNNNYPVRDLSVTTENGKPLFSGIEHYRDGSDYAVYMANIDMNLTQFNDRMRFLANLGWRIKDFNEYTKGGVRTFAAIFVIQDHKSSMLYGDLTLATVYPKMREMAQNGWYPTSLNVVKSFTGSGNTYSLIFTQQAAPTFALFDLSANDLKKKIEEMTNAGLTMVKVAGYDNGRKFAAIWARDLTD